MSGVPNNTYIWFVCPVFQVQCLNAIWDAPNRLKLKDYILYRYFVMNYRIQIAQWKRIESGCLSLSIDGLK